MTTGILGGSKVERQCMAIDRREEGGVVVEESGNRPSRDAGRE